MSSHLKNEVRDQVAWLTLARPERHNALDIDLIAALHEAIRSHDSGPVRAIVIAAEGESFCAGADLEWMRQAAGLKPQANFEDARQLASLLHAVASCNKPVVARVQGAAYGGGVGLAAACDIVVAADSAKFALTEVRIGLVAATISPYVLAAMGSRQAIRWVLTGQRFDAQRAAALGLVHEVVPAAGLDAALADILAALRLGAPAAQGQCKRLLREIEGEPFDPELIDDTARALAEIRAGAEAREGIAAFLEKRRPDWA